MKKVTTILAVIAVFSLGSCKKDYTCECTDGYSYTVNAKKADAKTSCDSFSSLYGGTETCKIK